LYKSPYKRFQSRFDKILERIPELGKLLASIFGFFERYILDTFRFIDNKFNITTINYVNKYLFRGRWGGKVVPLNKNISGEVRFLPTQEILEILKRSKVRGIGNCYCRETQRKSQKEPNCDYPIRSCIHFGFGKSLYEIPFKSENLKSISKQDVKKYLEKFDELGLVHQIIYYPNPQFYYIVCNCCPCCCVVLNKFLKGGSPQMIKSDFIAYTDLKKCINCGTCHEWCYFGARKIKNNKLIFHSNSCFGCGICVSKCPSNAIELVNNNLDLTFD
jgi:Pyruvate/2-oxoacid:ferredoxin oxidoreductase delta subunit